MVCGILARLVGQRTSCKQVRNINNENSRNLHLLCGAATPLRARSAEAGNWTGVAVITDLVPRAISLFWPQREYDYCRVQVYQVWHGPMPLTGANVYLWSPGPTWPRGKEASKALLTTLTKELVLSRAGPRFICGDVNMDIHQSEFAEIWRSHGWVDAQQWSERHCGWESIPTCKATTTGERHEQLGAFSRSHNDLSKVGNTYNCQNAICMDSARVCAVLAGPKWSTTKTGWKSYPEV